MKKTVVLFLTALIMAGFTGCVTNKAWEGVYTGLIPAADCEGINVKIMLKSDQSYELNYQYIGKPAGDFTRKGYFTWNKSKNLITLDLDNPPAYYRVGKDTLTHLDMYGKVIKGSLADMYVLKKEQR